MTKTQQQCECVDPGCECNGLCRKPGAMRLYRIDQTDESGTLFCSECGADALECGVFATEPSE